MTLDPPEPELCVTSLQTLIDLGSIYFLPPGSHSHIKPARVTASDLPVPLPSKAYLRVHFHPRRFSLPPSGFSSLPVIVAENFDVGYTVVNKPRGLPVHSTVDNALENLLHQYRLSLKSRNLGAPPVTKLNVQKSDLPYVSLPSRLDHDTSGVLLLATSRLFGAYFSELLRRKTSASLESRGEPLIRKMYRALVTVPSREAAADLPPTGVPITHYLEVTRRAPKIFHADNPEGVHQECKLIVTRLSEVLYDVPTAAAEALDLPPNCSGVAEVTVELLTGRTHQIRGQMKALGFPLAGDRMYGGGSREWEAGSDEDMKLCLQVRREEKRREEKRRRK